MSMKKQKSSAPKCTAASSSLAKCTATGSNSSILRCTSATSNSAPKCTASAASNGIAGKCTVVNTNVVTGGDGSATLPKCTCKAAGLSKSRENLTDKRQRSTTMTACCSAPNSKRAVKAHTSSDIGTSSVNRRKSGGVALDAWTSPSAPPHPAAAVTSSADQPASESTSVIGKHEVIFGFCNFDR